MSTRDDEKEFRLHPNRPLRVRDQNIAWSAAFKRILHFTRITSKRRQSAPSSAKHYNQRCAIRVTYSKNSVKGQWAAHGRYISRESAAGQEAGGNGFGSERPDIDISQALGDWQRAGDPRMFKIVISPEFGDRLDLETHTRKLLAQMEEDLETKLEWVAVIHRNTEHPHVHVALRGVDDKGSALRLPRDYIKGGIRQHAEELATQQIGFRTQFDADEAQRREVHQARFTSLDRTIKRAGQSGPEGNIFVVAGELRSTHARKRLFALQEMGLAEEDTGDRWRVKASFEQILREMQKTADRQKALSAHRAIMSDPNLPFQVTDIRKVDQLRGRVLGHGEEESTGRTYMLLEGDDKKVHFIYHNREIQESRNSGQLHAKSIVEIRKDGRRQAIRAGSFPNRSTNGHSDSNEPYGKSGQRSR